MRWLHRQPAASVTTEPWDIPPSCPMCGRPLPGQDLPESACCTCQPGASRVVPTAGRVPPATTPLPAGTPPEEIIRRLQGAAQGIRLTVQLGVDLPAGRHGYYDEGNRRLLIAAGTPACVAITIIKGVAMTLLGGLMEENQLISEAVALLFEANLSLESERLPGLTFWDIVPDHDAKMEIFHSRYTPTIEHIAKGIGLDLSRFHADGTG